MSGLFAKSDDVFDLVWIIFVLGAGLIQMLVKFKSNKKRETAKTPPIKTHTPPPARHVRQEKPTPPPAIDPEEQIREFFEKLTGVSTPKPAPVAPPPIAQPIHREQEPPPPPPVTPTPAVTAPEQVLPEPQAVSHITKNISHRATIPRGFRMKMSRVKIRPTQISHNLSGKNASTLRPDWSSRDTFRRQMVGHLILGKPRALE